jgi:acyl-CoA thioesterase
MNYLDEIASKGQLANPFFCQMGIKPVSCRDGKSRLSMEVRHDMTNGEGWLQGGMYTALGDEAMALAIYTLLNDKETIATVSCTTQYIRGVRNGVIYADGTVIKRGRQMIFAEATLTGAESDKLLARCTAAFTVRSDPGTG